MLCSIFGTIGGLAGIAFISCIEIEHKLREKQEIFKANLVKEWGYGIGVCSILMLLIATIL